MKTTIITLFLGIFLIICSSGFFTLAAQDKKPNLSLSMATPPEILSTSPAQNALNIVKSTNVTATFTTTMNTSTLNTSNILLYGSQSGKHSGAITLNGSTGFTFNPTADFKAGENVSVNLTDAITNSSADPLSNGYHWGFVVKATSGTGIFTQTSTTNLNISALPVSMTVADFDNDGDLDLATVNQTTNTVSVLTNNGLGTFSEDTTFTAGSGRNALTSGDWDNDGDIDLAIIGGGASGTVAILNNNGSGSFTQSSAPSTGLGPQAIASGDIDGDGDLDVVIALNSVNQVAVMANNGSGSFTSSSTPSVGTGPQDIALADFDNDGDLDIATVNFFSNDGTLLLNDGTGTFGSSSTFSTDNQPNSIAVGDYDNDGDLDMAVVNFSSNTLSILRNNGSGTFSEIDNPAVTSSPYGISALDVDADGDLDLAVTRSAADSITIFKNNGSAVFSSFSKNSVGSQPYRISAGDFDNDGDNDLAVTNRSGHSVSVLKNNFLTPSVSVTSPTVNQNNVAQNANVTVRFNRPMNTSTFTASTIQLFGSQSGKHTGSLTVSGDTSFTFNPDTDFRMGELVTVTLTKNITSLTGDTLTNGYHWNFTTLTSGGTAVFAESSSPIVPNGPVAVVIADFDNDGDADLSVTNSTADSVSILMNNASGSYNLSSSISVGDNPQGISAGDFDNDGDIDLAVANSTSNTVSILTNNGSGAFTQTSTPSLSGTPLALASGDLDGDGDIDLAVVRQTSTSVTILKNDGSGTFTEGVTVATGLFPNAIILGDIESDGDLDMLVTNSGATTISILKNNGTGAFPASATATVGNFPTSLASGDIDGDGDLDVLVVNRTDNTVSVLKNNGSGTLTLSSSPSVGSSPTGITIGNFDNDTDLDAAVVDQSSNSVSILKNGGTGTFTKTTLSGIDTAPTGIANADLDGDGDIDLVAAKTSSHNLSIIKNNVSSSFAVSPSSLNYGNIVLGSGLVKDSVVVTNAGSASLLLTSVSSSSVAFSVTPNGGTVAAGDSMKFYISFAPTGLGAFNGNIIFTHNAAGSPDTVSASGTGIENPDPVFSITPTSVNFGNILINTSTMDTLTVTNTGNNDLYITSVSSDNPKVTVSPSSDTLSNDQSGLFIVTITPDVAETVRANIVFAHNAAGSPDTVTVIGNALVTLPRYYLSLPPDTLTARKPGKTSFLAPVPRVKKNQMYPNWANLISEVVLEGGFRANASESDSMGGMRIGISHIYGTGKNKFKPVKDSAAIRPWVRLTKYTFPTPKAAGKGTGFAVIQTTLADKTGMHTGTARGLDSTGVPGQIKPKRTQLVKELTALPPAKHNNKLFAELVALKFNIAASQLEKTPVGFGELLFDVDGNPCDNMHVVSISRKVDSAMTYWRGNSQEYFDSLYSALYKINRAFIGALDTITFKKDNTLTLNGSVDVNTLTFLKYDSSMAAARLTPLIVKEEFDYAESEASETPAAYAIDQNYPNPFNPSTTIGFELQSPGTVTLTVYNTLGQQISTLINAGEYDAGKHEFAFDATGLASGVYYYKITIQGSGATSVYTEAKKMILQK